MDIRILYEDKYILAINKPSGLLVHSDGRSEEKTLVDWINENYPDLREVGEEQILQNGQKIKRPGIVHRLDRETSGVVVVAKTQESYLFLKKQFQDRKAIKVYRAFVWGSFKVLVSDIGKTIFSINKPIGRSGSDFRKWSAEFGAKGEKREAITHYSILAQINNPLNPPARNVVQAGEHYIKGGTEPFSYLEIYPKTGRTHQIRVHMKAVGHPVIGDRLYGEIKNKEILNERQKIEKSMGLNRLALHSLSIKLELPNHTFINIESPLPEEFERLRLLNQGF